MAARLAAAAGDAPALLALAIELAQEVSRLSAEAAILEDRRKKDAERKRNRPRKSSDVHGTHETGREIPHPPSPQVSLSSPTPLINPSFPPSPLPLQAPQGNAEEVRLHERAPEAVSVVEQFLAGKEPPARMAWIGRFHGALDRPPHPTGAELRDALGDLMTEPPENWKPALFRRYVDRIRNDANRSAERANALPALRAGAKGDPVGDAAWAATLALIPKWHARQVTAATMAEMSPGMKAGISAVGGFRVIAETPEAKRVWLKNDFLAAFRAAPPEPKEAKSA